MSATLTDPESRDAEVRFAAAALLVICAKSDFHSHPNEERAITDALHTVFHFEDSKIEDLLSQVDEETAVRQLQEFTSLINRYYTVAEKNELITHLWQVAFADGRLDRFEELFVGRVAFMLSVDDESVQACREFVEEQLKG